MSEQSGEHLEEEPQEERGPEGSRDTGSDEPSGGPVDRPEGTSDASRTPRSSPTMPTSPERRTCSPAAAERRHEKETQ